MGNRMVWRVALWGGASYAMPGESVAMPLARARRLWIERRDSGGRRMLPDDSGRMVFFPVWGEPPACERGCWVAGWAWHVPADRGDDPVSESPHRLLLVGPRGGVRWVRA